MKASEQNSKSSYFSNNAQKNILKGILAILLFITVQCSFAQVGIGNTNPQAALDISASNATSPANNDGILIPRMSNFPSNPGTTRDGMLIFYTGTGSSGKGFYYWDQSTTNWIYVGNEPNHDWYEQGTTNVPDNINDNMYTNGFVGINNNNPNVALDVNGKGEFYSGNTTGNTFSVTRSTQTTGAAIFAETTPTYNLSSYSAIETSNALTNYNVEVNKFTSGSILNTGVLITKNDVRNVNERGFVVDFQQTGTGNYLSENIGFLYDISYNGGGSGNLYGFKAELEGSGVADKYGVRIDIPSATNGSQFGIYSDVRNSNGFAGYFLGRTSFGINTSNRYLMPATAGANNQVMAMGTGGQVNFVDASSVFTDTDTDNQTVDQLTLSGTTLSLSLEDDGQAPQTVDLVSLQDGIGTDDQNLSFSLPFLSIENGNMVNLNAINTDNQTIDTFSFNTSTNELTIEIEDDGIAPQTVDLSSLIDLNDIDWYEEGTTTAPNNINDNMFTQGRVGIGDTTPDAVFDIEYTGSDLKASLIDFTTTSNSIGSSSSLANIPSALAVNSTANSANRQLISGLFSISGTMVNGASSSTSIYAQNTTTSQGITAGLALLIDAESDISYGINNEVISSPSTTNYGVSHMVSGASNANYGGSFSVSGTSNTNYGIRSSASGATTNWAGYFGSTGVSGSGNVYIKDLLEVDGALNFTDGNEAPGYILESNATGDASWVDPSTVFQDDQTIDTFSFNNSTNILTLEVEDDGIAAQTVDLSSLIQTDEIDWYEEGTALKPDNINDDIYTQGNVAIGKTTADYRLDIEETGAAITRGLNISKIDNTNSTTYGLYNSKTGNGTGSSYATYNTINGSGNGRRYGTYNLIGGTGTGRKYGTYNLINATSTGNQYAIRNVMNAVSGSAQAITVFNEVTSATTGNLYGTYNGMRGANSSQQRGVHNEFDTAVNATELTGVRNQLYEGTASGGIQGIMNDIQVSSNSTIYGVRTEYNASASGTGNKYGTYNVIPSGVGGAHYGVYSDARKSNSYSGYFLGRVSIGTTTTNNYILPASRGANGQVMTTNGTGIVSWQTPTIGDITAVIAGAGLTGGGTNGNTTLTAAANNGLNVDGGADRIQLGGPLTEDTTITYGTFDTRFNLNNTGDFIIQDNGTGKFIVQDNGDTVLGGDLYWRDENTGGTVIARMIDDDNDGLLQIYENGSVSIALDANGTSVFNEQSFDRDFRVESDNNENMFRVDAGNNRIGIGTATPDAMLDIEGNSGSVSQLELTETQADDGGRIRFNNSMETDNRWTVYGRADNTDADSQFNIFYSGTSTNIMRLEGDGDIEFTGDLGINFNNPIFDLQLGANSAAKPGSNTWVVASDRRLKQNIKPYSLGMDLINLLNPVSFQYNGKAQIKDTDTHVGFIAQDIQNIAPQMVSQWTTEEGENFLALDTNEVQFAVINALKKQQKQIQALEAENLTLKTKLNQLENFEARLNALENNKNH